MRCVGERSLIPAAERALVTSALWRLLFICLAVAAGETIAYQLDLVSDATLVGLVFGVVAYLLTLDQARPRPGGGGRRGESKYWRGHRRGDDEPPPRSHWYAQLLHVRAPRAAVSQPRTPLARRASRETPVA